ncbi:hypothetical protein [Laceyella putida]|uniref:YopX protein domain-containing protein n=1 Tax=Laceyella putida TaxID=110101 RepID=A0ABW2RQU0_9BACL
MFDMEMLDYANSEEVGDLDGFIAKYCYPTDKEGEYKGFTLFKGYEVEQDIPVLFEEKVEWADGGHRRVWVSEVDLAKIVYVEGDIYVTVYKDESEYNEGLNESEEFYRG